MRRKNPPPQSGKRGGSYFLIGTLSHSDIPALISILSSTGHRRILFSGSFQTSTPAIWMPTRLHMPRGSANPVSMNSAARG